jgi:hypothetical protein
MRQDPERYEQIRNAQLVHTSFARQRLQFLAGHPNYSPGRLRDIHCIQHQQVGTVPDVGEQFQAQRAALNQRHILGQSCIVSQSLDGLRADTVVRVQGVAQAEHNAGRWCRHSVHLTQYRIFFQFGLRNER